MRSRDYDHARAHAHTLRTAGAPMRSVSFHTERLSSSRSSRSRSVVRSAAQKDTCVTRALGSCAVATRSASVYARVACLRGKSVHTNRAASRQSSSLTGLTSSPPPTPLSSWLADDARASTRAARLRGVAEEYTHARPHTCSPRTMRSKYSASAARSGVHVSVQVAGMPMRSREFTLVHATRRRACERVGGRARTLQRTPL